MKVAGIGISICGACSATGSNSDGFIGIGRIETSSFIAGGISAAATAACAADSTEAAALAVLFHVEHVIARQHGGSDDPSNLALACHGCNQHKGKQTSAQDPLTGILAPLFHPREHRWDEHFAWSEDFTMMVGLTEIGRATISALQLNRPGLVNLRRALYAIAEHPPNIN